MHDGRFGKDQNGFRAISSLLTPEVDLGPLSRGDFLELLGPLHFGSEKVRIEGVLCKGRKA